MKQLFTVIILLIIFSPCMAQSWQPLSIPTTRDIISSSFISDEDGWIGTAIGGGPGLLYHTSDGGATWDEMAIQGGYGSSYVCFLNSSTGYAVVDGHLYKSTDGGLIWDVLTLPGLVFSEPFFLNEATGYVAGEGIVYKTTDGGMNWVSYPYDAPYYHITKMNFFDEQHGAAVDNANFLYSTSDGAVTWDVLSDGGLWCYNSGVTHLPNGEMISCAYCDVIGDYSVGTSGPGDGYYSDDNEYIWDVKALDENRTYAVLSDGVVAYTNDGGATWNEDNLGNVFLNIVDGSDDVFVFGNDGKGFKFDASACYTTAGFSYTLNDIEVTFINQSVNATTWLWNFGDGTTSTDQNPVHPYTDDGDYTVCLTSEDAVCASDNLCVEILICAANNSASPNGTLDISFDDDGIVTTNISSNADQVATLLIQQDGKILAVEDGYGSITRYNTDGSLDSTFSSDGIVSGLFDINVNTAALTADGKILVGGDDYPYKIAVYRLNADGTVDSTFGNDGIKKIDIAAGDVVNSFLDLAVLNDGKIMVAAMYEDENYDDVPVLARLHPNGGLDASFGTGGIVDLGSSFNFEFLIWYYSDADICIQGDGKILLSGTTEDTDEKFALLRVNADGTPDNSFGNGGLLVTNISSGTYNLDYVEDVLQQADGKLIAVGEGYYDADPSKFAVVRYQLNGDIDSTYGNNGIVTLQLANDRNDPTAAILQPDGKMLIAGRVIDEGEFMKIGLARLTPSGTLDNTFGNAGYVLTHVECSSTQPFCLALDDDKIYAGGITNPSYSNSFVVVRYLNETCPVPLSGFNYAFSGLEVQFTDQFTGAISWSWNFGDGTFSSDQNPLHSYLLPGIYNVCLVTFNGCGNDTFCQVVDLIATVTDPFSNLVTAFKIIPNPFHDKMTTEYELQQSANVTFQVTDLTGRILYSTSSMSNNEGKHFEELDLEEISSGMYMLEIKCGSQHSFHKIMKQ